LSGARAGASANGLLTSRETRPFPSNGTENSVGFVANLKLAATPLHHGDGRGFQSPHLNAVIHRGRTPDVLSKT